MFYKQIILQRGFPFEVKMPSARPVDISALSEAQMNAELEKGYADMQSGHNRSAKSVYLVLYIPDDDTNLFFMPIFTEGGIDRG